MSECKHGPVEGTEYYAKAAALIGMDPKKLAGRIWRDKVGDPVGCKVCGYVYPDTIRPTDDSTAEHGLDGRPSVKAPHVAPHEGYSAPRETESHGS